MGQDLREKERKEGRKTERESGRWRKRERKLVANEE